METPDLLHMLVTQAWQVTAIAIGVWIVASTIAKNHPQMAHLLWAVVLLKVLAPPIWSSPVGVFSWLERTCSVSVSSAAEQVLEHSADGFVSSAHRPASDMRVRSDAGIAQQDSDALVNTDEAKLRSAQTTQGQTWSWKQWLVALWLCGTAVSLLLAGVRLFRFARWVASHDKRSTALTESVQQLEQRLTSLLESVALKLRVRRPVALRIVEAPTGPAVFGLWRPTIVLSAAMLRNRSNAEIEPLLAHELVHIRRGDLWWAGIQSLATSLFWFHPLVWLASRMLTRESERSCDEQTIASLGCSAATYARSLLDVLERKNQLRVAPALPGVRPVDITRSRLERIMRLGQGSRQTTPAWAWSIFIGCIVMLLPGGAWLSAQDSASTGTPQVVTPSAPAPVPPATGPWPERIQRVNLEVGDLLEQLEEMDNTREQAEQMLLSLIPQRTLDQVNEEAAKYGAHMSGFPTPSIEGSTLHLLETREQITSVEATIKQLREFGFRQVAVQVHLISLSKDHLEKLAIDWKQALPWVSNESSFKRPNDEQFVSEESLAPRDSGLVVAASFEQSRPMQIHSGNPISMQALRIPVTPTATFFAVLAREETARLIARAQSDARTNILMTPRVTLFNGQDATIVDLVQRPFVTGIGGSVVSDHGMKGWLTFVEVAEIGTKLRVVPVIKEDRAIELSLAMNKSFIRDVQTFTFDKSKSADGAVETGSTVQIPDVISKGLSLKAAIQPGQSIVFTGGVPLEPGKDTVEIALATAFEIDVNAPNDPAEASPTPSAVTQQSK